MEFGHLLPRTTDHFIRWCTLEIDSGDDVAQSPLQNQSIFKMTRRKMFNRFGPYLVCYFVFALILGVQSGLFDPDQQVKISFKFRVSLKSCV